MKTKLLHLFDQQAQLSIVEINNQLQQSTIQTLSQIAEINKLQAGLINLHDGKYSLAYKLDWFDKSTITQLLKEKQLDYQIHLFDKIDSTNNHATKHIEEYPSKTIISCDWQHTGKGRFGRSWSNQIAKDIAITIIYHFSPEFNLALLPMVCAVAINRLLKNHAIKNKIKWPNDIYVEKAKAAGILVENIFRGKQAKTLIGIGLNNLANWERNKLVVDLVQSLDSILAEFELFGFPLLRREWLDNCIHLNKSVLIQQEGLTIDQGIHTDIGEKGELIIKNNSGQNTYSSTNISLLIKDQQ